MGNVNATIASRTEEARARIADLLLEIDYITLQANPQIQAEYATKVGYLENDLLKWQITARRARRRLALAQARANVGETFGADEFESQLDEELAEWEGLLAKSIEVFLQAAERMSCSKPLSPSDSREMKRLHRELIKRLHPDLHPGQSDEAARFFMVAQAAYENGDLQMLRAIAVATEGMSEKLQANGLSDDEEAAELEIVLAHERVLEQQLEDLKSSNPYALGEKLTDGDWLVRRVSGLKAQIREQKAAAEVYDERFRALMEGVGNDC